MCKFEGQGLYRSAYRIAGQWFSDFCKCDVRFVPGGASQLASSTAHGWAIQVTTPRINVGSYVAPPAVNQIYFIEAGL